MIEDSMIEMYLQADEDVLGFEVVSQTMFRVRVQVGGRPDLGAVDLIVSTGVNDAMLLIVAMVDQDRLPAAIAATGQIGVVGLCGIGDGYALRYGVFKQDSDIMAMTNGLQAMALAYNAYMSA